MRPPVKPLLNVAIAAGLILAAWPLVQTAYGHWSQRQLAQEWEQQVKTHPNPRAHHANKQRPKPQIAAKGSASSVLMASVTTPVKRPKWPLTKISIPEISLEAYVVNGWDDAALRKGPAHEPNSSLPGEGNCVIAGHRNVYGSHFYRLDELIPGSPIHLETPDGSYTYLARSPVIVSEANVSILQPPPIGTPPTLTLITCTLPHSPNRIVLQADLSENAE